MHKGRDSYNNPRVVNGAGQAERGLIFWFNHAHGPFCAYGILVSIDIPWRSLFVIKVSNLSNWTSVERNSSLDLLNKHLGNKLLPARKVLTNSVALKNPLQFQ